MTDTKEKLSRPTVWLHWLAGITIIALLTVGVYMSETETAFLYPIHKSIGVIVFVVVLARVIWRIKTGWLAHIGNLKTLSASPPESVTGR